MIVEFDGKYIDQIYKIYKEEGWNSFTKDVIIGISTGSKWIIVKENNQIVGFARYITDGILTIFLCEIIVKKDYRRNGVGRRIIDEIFKRYPNLRIDLISEEDEFYNDIGFRKVGNGYRGYNLKE